jgi:thiol-disulfide isomerase/thioredoxin
MPGSLVMTTVRTVAKGWAKQAVHGLPANAVTLAEAVIKSMWMSKVRLAGAVLGACFILSGAGFLLNRSVAEPPDGVAQTELAPTSTASQASETKSKGVPTDQKFETATGYAWAIAPDNCPRGACWAVGWVPPPVPGLRSETGISAIEDKAQDGGFLITLAFPPPTELIAHVTSVGFRPVAFDAKRNRYLPTMEAAVATSTATLSRFHLDPKLLPADQVKFLGIEALTANGAKLFAKLAAQKARKAGVLPFPQAGEVYDFVLTAIDGRKITSSDLRGKVVLIDCWATWCSPSVERLPELKRLHEKHHGEGLEVIGVNFDTEPEKAKETCTSLGLEWPQVFVTVDEKKRSMWAVEPPGLLLIDRKGILHAKGSVLAEPPSKLEPEIAKLLKEKDNK